LNNGKLDCSLYCTLILLGPDGVHWGMGTMSNESKGAGVSGRGQAV
jgi:hypothetical protein